MNTRRSAKRAACESALGLSNGQHKVRVALDPEEILKKFKEVSLNIDNDPTITAQTNSVFSLDKANE